MMTTALRRHGHVLLGRRRVRQGRGVVAAAVPGASAVGVGSKLLAHLVITAGMMVGVMHHVLVLVRRRRHSLDAPQDGHVARLLDPARGMLPQLEGRRTSSVRRQEAGGGTGIGMGIVVVAVGIAAAGVFGHQRVVAVVVRRGDAAEGHRRQGRRILVFCFLLETAHGWSDGVWLVGVTPAAVLCVVAKGPMLLHRIMCHGAI